MPSPTTLKETEQEIYLRLKEQGYLEYTIEGASLLYNPEEAEDEIFDDTNPRHCLNIADFLAQRRGGNSLFIRENERMRMVSHLADKVNDLCASKTSRDFVWDLEQYRQSLKQQQSANSSFKHMEYKYAEVIQNMINQLENKPDTNFIKYSLKLMLKKYGKQEGIGLINVIRDIKIRYANKRNELLTEVGKLKNKSSFPKLKERRKFSFFSMPSPEGLLTEIEAQKDKLLKEEGQNDNAFLHYSQSQEGEKKLPSLLKREEQSYDSLNELKKPGSSP